MRQQILLIVLCLCSCLVTSAQTVNAVRTFTVRDGLPSNAITAIEEDIRGLIWLSTWNGLCCYDGYRFTSFRGKEWGDDHALSSRRISMIEPDSQGNIWVRTYNGGLYLLNTRQCEYTNIGLLLERKYGKTILPRNIYSLSNGYTWITDEHGEQNLRIDDRYPADIEKMEIIDIKDLPLNHYIKKVETDPQGHEWIITDAGMIRYGTKEVRKRVFTNYSDENKTPTLSEQWIKNHPELGISKAFTDHQGNLWYSSPIGLTLVNFRNYVMRQVIVEPRQQTRSVACRKDGTVWVGSYSGHIAIFDSDGQQKGWLSPQGKISTTMIRFADRIYTMCEDNKGNMWIGTRGQGIYVVMAGEPSVKHYMHQDADPYSLSHNDVYDIDQDNEGQIWIATFGGGVNLVRSVEREVKSEENLRFLHKGNDLKQYPHEGFDKVRCITHDHKGNMLASTTWGLMTFLSHTDHPQDLNFHLSRQKQNDVSSLRTNDVMQVLVTRQGDIYVLTVGGCIQKLVYDNLQEDQLKFETPLNMDQGFGSSMSLVEDRQGFVWVLRESEINRYDTDTDQIIRFGPNSMDANAQITEAKPVVDVNGKLWAGTSSGVLILDTHQTQRSDYKPNIVFTNILFQGEDVEHPIIGRQVINITEREQRNLTIRFAALDYSDNYLMEYAYRMKESGEEWNYIGNDPHIAFSQLPAGEHTLIVRSTNCDGVWVDNATELLIDVKPMFWERLWVKLLAMLITIGLSTVALIGYLSHRRQARERDKRLESILSQYRKLEEKREYTLREPVIVDTDEQMMNSLMEYIERRIGDESLKVEEMAEAVGMGRTAFFEKMKKLVGISPSDFLRQVRMQRACQLLKKSKLTVSEIAYSVGFSDPKYFTKCFKKEMGKTPSEYKNSL